LRDAKFSGIADHEVGTVSADEKRDWKKLAEEFLMQHSARKAAEQKGKTYTVKDLQSP